ncbi:MAG: sensor domain-containing diguanylate cyclase [Thermoanaerobaculaceae bacterium]|nr:sensor domain-containing diguanylate cyclase [Thermoanaerobaculaceae bacterium]
MTKATKKSGRNPLHHRRCKSEDKSSEKVKCLAEELHSKSEQLRLLSEVIRTANSYLEPDAVINFIMERIRHLVECQAWSLLLLDEESNQLYFKAALGEKSDKLSEIRLKIGEGVAGKAVETGQPMIVDDAQKCPYFNPEIDRLTNFKTRNILAVPLKARGKIIGAFEIINKKGKSEDSFTEKDLETVMLFLEPAAIALENAMLFQKTKELTLIDDLTHLFNTRYLYQSLKSEISRGKRYGYPLAVIFLDLDGFKAVNDINGHLVGSATLKIVAKILKDGIRNVDIAARYGGDEFTLILPNTDAEGAKVVAERLRSKIENHPYEEDLGVKIKLSASFGIAIFPQNGDNPEVLIQKADQAMYKVKETTKNAICVSD